MSVSLKIQNQKIELIQWLSTIEDSSIIEKIAALRKAESQDWYASISNSEKKSIDSGIQDAEEGKLNSHSKARKLYEKWL
ncbi:hypothetical protein [Flavobacterium silvaticum]|uniref:Uncharacterized protein n=1 Tax=Flavobacterium silvaticum TaxID=1852020 RepID=A0A972FIA5_9FLAO|nr:hypothetical protein [Flavobacterium silvaticum]NMH26461.1 hypothetical protein [Flavobacterium silvaticum]